MSDLSIYLQLGISFILALIITLYSLRIVVHVVQKLNLFDQPNGRSAAEKPIPTLGGIAIFVGFVFASTLGMTGFEFPEQIYILLATMLIFFVGLKDDVVTLPPYKKIIAQIAAASIIIFLAKIRFTNLHGLFGIGEIGLFYSFILTAFTIIVIINAFNLMDGIDGLAAGLSILAALVFGGWFFVSGNYGYTVLSVSVIGATAGFFYLNVYGKRYKIFMGDTGSLLLGTIVSILMIRFVEGNIDQSQTYSVTSAPGVAFGILFYPLFDTVRVMVIRIRNRRSPFSADKNHLHHRLLLLGNSHKRATYTIIAMNILFIILVFAIHHYGILWLIGLVTIFGLILFSIPAFIIEKKGLIKKNDPYQYFLIPRSSDEIGGDGRGPSRIKKRVPKYPVPDRQSFIQKFNLW